MGTGFNSQSIAELGEGMAEYFSIDHDEEDEDDKRILDDLRSGDEAKIREILNIKEMSIEEGNTPWCIECNSNNTEVYFDTDSGTDQSFCRCKDCGEEGVL